MADEPKLSPPVPQYPKESWLHKPWGLVHSGDFRDFVADWYWAESEQSLLTVASRFGFDAKSLARFNWGIADPNWEQLVNYYLKNYCGCRWRVDKYVFSGRPCVHGLWTPVPKAPASSPDAFYIPKTAATKLKNKMCVDPSDPQKRPSDCVQQKSVRCLSHDEIGGMEVEVKLGPKWSGMREKTISEFVEAQSWLMCLRERAGTITLPPEKTAGAGAPDKLTIRQQTLTLDISAGLSAVAKNHRVARFKAVEPLVVPGPTVVWTPEEQNVLSLPREMEAVAEHLRIMSRAGVIKRLVVRGYACKAGSFSHNHDLSKARAEYVRDKLTRRFKLRFKDPALITACGKMFSKQPVSFDRSVVIEVEKKPPEKSEEAKEIEAIFEKAEKSEKKLKDSSKTVFLFGQGIYSWSYTDMVLGEGTDRCARRTTLTYVQDEKSTTATNPSEFENLKRHISAFIGVFEDMLLETDPGGYDLCEKKVRRFVEWAQNLSFHRDGDVEGDELTPSWDNLNFLFYLRGFELPKAIKLLLSPLNDFSESEKEEKINSLPEEGPAREKARALLNALAEGDFTCASVDVHEEATSGAALRARNFTHDLPPLVVHFNFDKPSGKHLSGHS